MGQNVMEQAFAKAKAAIDAAVADRDRLAAPALDAIKKASDAAQAARAQEAMAQAQAGMQAAVAAAQAAAAWKQKEETIEDALEHAGISGVDVQIDANGFAKLVGSVTSDLDRDTAISMVEQFEVTGMESQLQVVPPPVVDASEDPLAGAGDAPVKYKVKAGESWWGIAQRVYGNGNLWKSLKAANNNPRMIHPGTEILLPPKSTLK
ncbi:MAG: LysM peptidoglycan-binding domain-containing protein [Deltaproteobacteria bacterium]|nr:LysM peptidoglycan-binding domain-containing protein [Deltaproteobacteria bacterium]